MARRVPALILVALSLPACSWWVVTARSDLEGAANADRLSVVLTPKERGSFLLEVEGVGEPLTVNWDRSYFIDAKGERHPVVVPVDEQAVLQSIVLPAACREHQAALGRCVPDAADANRYADTVSLGGVRYKTVPRQCCPRPPDVRQSTVTPDAPGRFVIYSAGHLAFSAKETCIRHRWVAHSAAAKAVAELARAGRMARCEKALLAQGDHGTWITEQLVDEKGEVVRDAKGDPVTRHRKQLPSVCEKMEVPSHALRCEKTGLVGHWRFDWFAPANLYRAFVEQTAINGPNKDDLQERGLTGLLLVLVVETRGTARELRVKMQFEFEETTSEQMQRRQAAARARRRTRGKATPGRKHWEEISRTRFGP